MKACSPLLGIAVAVLVLPARANAFEGVLHMLMTMPQSAPVKTDVSIRNNGDSRTDTYVPFLNQKVSFIQRGTSPVVQIIHSTKQYSESGYLAGKAASDVSAQLRNLTVRELPSETVAGYACRHAMLTNASGANIEIWVTSAIPTGSGSLSMISGDGDALMQALKRQGLDGFPLKVKMVEQGLPITLETVSVEAKSVESALFSVPAGYTKVAESDMGLRDLTGDELDVLKAFEKQLNAAGAE